MRGIVEIEIKFRTSCSDIILNYIFIQKLKEIANLIILPYNCNRHNAEMYRCLPTKNSPTKILL